MTLLTGRQLSRLHDHKVYNVRAEKYMANGQTLSHYPCLQAIVAGCPKLSSDRSIVPILFYLHYRRPNHSCVKSANDSGTFGKSQTTLNCPQLILSPMQMAATSFIACFAFQPIAKSPHCDHSAHVSNWSILHSNLFLRPRGWVYSELRSIISTDKTAAAQQCAPF